MTLFLGIMLISINGTDISLQTIYGTYLNENFYLIKINKPLPKINNNEFMINLSISFEDYIFINFSPKNCKNYITKNKDSPLYLSFITTLIFYLNDKLSSYYNYPLQK